MNPVRNISPAQSRTTEERHAPGAADSPKPGAGTPSGQRLAKDSIADLFGAAPAQTESRSGVFFDLLAPPATYASEYRCAATLPPLQPHHYGFRAGNVYIAADLGADYQALREHALDCETGRRYLAKFEDARALPTYLVRARGRSSMGPVIRRPFNADRRNVALKILLWDPRLATLTTTGGTISPATAGLHECAHAVHAQIQHERGVPLWDARIKSAMPDYTNAEEHAVITGLEHALMQVHHEGPARDDHADAGFYTAAGPRSIAPANPVLTRHIEKTKRDLQTLTTRIARARNRYVRTARILERANHIRYSRALLRKNDVCVTDTDQELLRKGMEAVQNAQLQRALGETALPDATQ